MTYPIPIRVRESIRRNTQQWIRLWRITRKDNLILRFTDHNVEVVYEDETYTPAGGFNASAVEHGNELRSTNKEFRGVVLEDEAITFEDLQAGRYSGATVRETLLDWSQDRGLPAIGEYEFILDNVRWTGERFDADALDIKARLRQRIGRAYSKSCDVERLGDSRCKVNVGAMRLTGRSVTFVVQDRFQMHTDISTALDVDGTTKALVDAEFANGEVEWKSGDNVGLFSPVASSYVSDGRIVFQTPTPFPIEVGDEFDITPGCYRSVEHCQDKFNNIKNHRGFPFMPGTDASMSAPNAK